MTESRCVIPTCGRAITYQFSLCAECEDTYGRRADEWPEWVRFLVNDGRRMRREDTRLKQNEFFPPYDTDILIENKEDKQMYQRWVTITQAHGRDGFEMVLVGNALAAWDEIDYAAYFADSDLERMYAT